MVDDLDKLLQNQQFATDNWDRRVKTLNCYMRMAAAACAVILMVYLGTVVYSVYTGVEVKINEGVNDLLSAAFFVLVTFIGSGIGSYVFGAQMDTNSFRSSIISLASRRATKTPTE